MDSSVKTEKIPDKIGMPYNSVYGQADSTSSPVTQKYITLM